MIKFKRVRYSKRDRIHYLINYYGPVVFIAAVVIFIVLLVANSFPTPGVDG